MPKTIASSLQGLPSASPEDHPCWGTAAIRAFDGEAPHGHRPAPGSFSPGRKDSAITWDAWV